MFDSMGPAIKKHAGKIKLRKHMPEGSPLEEKHESKTEEEKEQTDMAPEVGGEQSMHPPHTAHQMPSEIGPQHIELLKQLIAHLGDQGRPAIGLDEKAHMGMKEKLASMVGHKK